MAKITSVVHGISKHTKKHFHHTKQHFVKHIARKIKIKYILVSLALFLLIENGLFALNNLQNKTTVLGLRFEGKNLTQLNREQINKIILNEAEQRKQPLKLLFKEHIFEIHPSDVGFKIDSGLQTNDVFQYGRTGNFMQKLFYQHLAIFGFANILLSGHVSQSLVTLQLISLQNSINQDSQPESLNFTHNLESIPARDGEILNVAATRSLISDNILHPPYQAVAIPTIKVFARQHESQELDPIRNSVIKLTSQPIILSAAHETFQLTPEGLRSMLTIVERADPTEPKKSVLVLRLDEKILNKKLGELAQRIESKSGSILNEYDARIAVYSQFFSGKRKTIEISTGKIQFPPNVLMQKSITGLKTVYLTFDAGPNAIYYPIILNILNAYDVKATFFLVGQNSLYLPYLLKQTVNEGHIIGNQSFSYSFLPDLPSDAILQEIEKTNSSLQSVIRNQKIQLFRPPEAGINANILKDIKVAGLNEVLWNLDSFDWTESNPGDLLNRISANVRPGSIILFHANHLSTLRTLPILIEQLRNQEYTFGLINGN